MIEKDFRGIEEVCDVTFRFRLTTEADASTINLCGEFNNWGTTANPMRRLKDGTFVITLPLKIGRSYRFRYLLDDERWENDDAADVM